MSIAERVRQLREKKGMTQKQLAEASGITQASMSRIESGIVKQPRHEALKGLAVALGVTVDYLIGKTVSLTMKDIVQSDETAQFIFRGYEKLSATQKEQLKNFVRFLAKQEGKREGGKR